MLPILTLMRRNINLVAKVPKNNFLEIHIYNFLFYAHKHKNTHQTVFQSRKYVFGSFKYDFRLSSWNRLQNILQA
jgi:hypothetical protein